MARGAMTATSLECVFVACFLLISFNRVDGRHPLDEMRPPLLVLPDKPAHDNVAFILLPENGIRCEAYLPLVRAVKAVAKFRLWAAIFNATRADRIQRLPFIVADALERLNNLGMRTTTVFLAAHGDAGQDIQRYARLVPDIVKGVILYSSNADNDRVSYPLMVVSGEIDTVIHVSDHVVTFKKVRNAVARKKKMAQYTHPVIIIKGSDHSSMLSPGRLDERERNQAVILEFAEYTSTFIVVVTGRPKAYRTNSLRKLRKAFKETSRIMQVRSVVVGADNSTEPMAFKDGKNVVLKTVVSFRFNTTEKYGRRTPRQMLLKMTSPEQIRALMAFSGTKLANSTQERSLTCKDLNYAAFVTAYRVASPKIRRRFDVANRGALFNDDVKAQNIREFHERQLIVENKGREAIVTGIQFRTEIGANQSGLFYCVALPPSRALQWIYRAALTEDSIL